MSTDLYGIRILKKEPEQKKITIKVIVVYYDVTYKSHEPVPMDKSLFLRVLCDNGDDAFIGKEIAQDDWLDEDWVAANAYKYIDDVKQLNTKNYPIKNWDGYHDFYYGDGPWKDEEKLVQADYEVYVSDARLFEHLEEGQSWGTTSYETQSYVHPGAAAPFMPNMDSEIRLEPFTGDEDSTETIVFTKDSSKLIALSSYNEIACFDTSDWKELWRVKFDEMYGHMSIDDVEGIVWLTSYDEVVGVVDIATGAISDKTPKSTKRHFSRTGKYAVDYGDDEFLHFGGDRKIEQPNVVEAVSFSEDDRVVALGGMYNSVNIFDLGNDSLLQTITTKDRVMRVALSADAKYLAVGKYDVVAIYEVASGKIVMNNIKRDGTSFGTPVWSPDGNYFALSHYTNRGYNSHTSVYKIGME